MENAEKILNHFPKRILLLILSTLTILAFTFVVSVSTKRNELIVQVSSFASFKSIFNNPRPSQNSLHGSRTDKPLKEGSRIAICLVGRARRFELTGPSIMERVLRVYNDSDLFLHSPLDSNAYKFVLLKDAPNIAGVRIFEPKQIEITESAARVLTAANSPNGIQGLLQYFNLVEGCLTMINSYQEKNNFIYDWIIRTRVDGYWSASLGSENFIPGEYLVPQGSAHGGLNDRFGVGDYNTSLVALSRISLISQMDLVGFTRLNSESAFKAQLATQNVKYTTKRFPFCVVSDRKYDYSPRRIRVPVAALSSPGPLSGAKCRPCKPICTGPCVGPIMNGLYKRLSWTEWSNNSLELCDAHGDWESGWEDLFDKVAGENLATKRKRIRALDMDACIDGFERMRKRTAQWDGPKPVDICKLGLNPQIKVKEKGRIDNHAQSKDRD